VKDKTLHLSDNQNNRYSKRLKAHFCSILTMPSVLWRCWLGSKKGIRPGFTFLVLAHPGDPGQNPRGP